MSRPAREIAVSLTIEQQQFRVRIREQGPFAWVATIGEQTGRLGSTGGLGMTKMATSPEAALRRAIDDILLMVGPLGTASAQPQEAPPEEPQPERPAEAPRTRSSVPAPPTPWRRLGR